MKIDTTKLDVAMANACMSAADLCDKSEISKPTFAKIRTGKRNPKPITVGKIAKALNCSVTDLLE